MNRITMKVIKIRKIIVLMIVACMVIGVGSASADSEPVANGNVGDIDHLQNQGMDCANNDATHKAMQNQEQYQRPE